MEKILVIGSANMDFVINVDRLPVKGETILSSSFGQHPGGKGANQAIAVAKLGGQVSMIGAVGKDKYAEQLLSNLNEFHVETSGIARVDTNTGLAFIYVNKMGENCIVVSPGANNYLNTEQIDKMLKSERDIGWIILQMEIPETFAEYVIKKAYSLGKKVVLNPAPAPPNGYPGELYTMLDLITPNETELQKLTNLPVDSIEDIIYAAKILHNKGAARVIVTCGKNGAVLVDYKNVSHFPAPEVNAIDSTAAGDTFTAAIVCALSENKSINEAIEFANCAASITVTREGAISSIPTRDEVDRALIKVNN